MGKLHARGNGITEDIDFNWLYQMYASNIKTGAYWHRDG